MGAQSDPDPGPRALAKLARFTRNLVAGHSAGLPGWNHIHILGFEERDGWSSGRPGRFRRNRFEIGLRKAGGADLDPAVRPDQEQRGRISEAISVRNWVTLAIDENRERNAKFFRELARVFRMILGNSPESEI